MQKTRPRKKLPATRKAQQNDTINNEAEARGGENVTVSSHYYYVKSSFSETAVITIHEHAVIHDLYNRDKEKYHIV